MELSLEPQKIREGFPNLGFWGDQVGGYPARPKRNQPGLRAGFLKNGKVPGKRKALSGFLAAAFT
jgi:hypothetical protein